MMERRRGMAVMRIVVFVNYTLNGTALVPRIPNIMVLLKYRATRLTITIHAGLSIPMISDSSCAADKKDDSSENPYR
jgi:hypothetical protein